MQDCEINKKGFIFKILNRHTVESLLRHTKQIQTAASYEKQSQKTNAK